MTQHVVRGEAAHAPGEIVDGDAARDGIAGGWAEPAVEETAVETPEGASRRRAARIERRA